MQARMYQHSSKSSQPQKWRRMTSISHPAVMWLPTMQSRFCQSRMLWCFFARPTKSGASPTKSLTGPWSNLASEVGVDRQTNPPVQMNSSNPGTLEEWRPICIRDVTLRTDQSDPRRLPEATFEYVDVSGVSRDSLRIVSTTR